MSFSTELAESFIGPLIGKTTTFVLDGRSVNISFAHAAMALLALNGADSTALDLDALYSSCSNQIFESVPAEAVRSTMIQMPYPGSNIEDELARVFATDSEVIILDSLNTLYHLLSIDNGSYRGRKLSFAFAGLSFVARTGRKAVFLTMYRREGFRRAGASRSISNLSDVTASVEVSQNQLVIKCERGAAWPEGRISIRIP